MDVLQRYLDYLDGLTCCSDRAKHTNLPTVLQSLMFTEACTDKFYCTYNEEKICICDDWWA